MTSSYVLDNVVTMSYAEEPDVAKDYDFRHLSMTCRTS